MFLTSVVQVQQVNKNVDLTRIKKLPTVRVGHFSPKRNAQNIYSLKFQYLYKQDTQNLPISMSIILSLRHQTFNKE